ADHVSNLLNVTWLTKSDAGVLHRKARYGSPRTCSLNYYRRPSWGTTMDITEPWATRPVDPPVYLLSRWLFLRLLGAVYLVAFVAGGASPGPPWRTRHPARRIVPRAGPCAVRRRGLPPVSHPLLARRERRRAAAARLGWRRPGALAHRRRRAGPRPPAPLDVLPVAQRRRPSLP